MSATTETLNVRVTAEMREAIRTPASPKTYGITAGREIAAAAVSIDEENS